MTRLISDRRRRALAARTFDPANLADAWAVWDPDREVTLSGSDITAMPDLSGNSRDLTYNTFSGVATIQTHDDKDYASMPSSGNTNARFDLTGTLIADGSDQPFTIWGVFRLDTVASYSGIFTMMNSGATASNYLTLYTQVPPVLRLEGWDSGGLRTGVSISITPQADTNYAYVVRVNGDGTFSAWINGVKVNDSTAFAPGTINGIDALAYGATVRGSVVNSEMYGDLGPSGIAVSALSDAVCVKLAKYLNEGWA